MNSDMVNHPPHYKSHPSGVEVIEITEHMNFCLGNVIKYVLRADHKGSATQDLEKALWYLRREIERRKNQEETSGMTAEEFFDPPLKRNPNSDFLECL